MLQATVARLKHLFKEIKHHCTDAWEGQHLNGVKCLLKDFDHPLTFLTIEVNLRPFEIRTANGIERRFLKVRRRTRPVGSFINHQSRRANLIWYFYPRKPKRRDDYSFCHKTT